MRASEALILGYFCYVLLTGWLLRLPTARRRRMLALAVPAAVILLAITVAGELAFLTVARDVAPGAFILIGYWLSGLLFVEPDVRLENRLAALDRGLFETLRLGRFISAAPRLLLEYLELAYLFCYPIVPAGFFVLYLTGFAAEAERLWTAVIGATFLSYGALPWLPTRPPRAIETALPIDRRELILRRVNQLVLDRGSIQVNTIPSGHAASAFATAFAVGSVLPGVGIIFGILAVSIAAASILGRYHYAVDSALGLLAAAAAWLTVTSW